MPEPSDVTLSMSERLSKVEANIDSMRDAFERHAEATSRAIAKLTHHIDDLAAKNAARDRTNWTQLASLAAVVLVIIGMIGSGYVRDMNRLEAAVARLDRDYRRVALKASEVSARILALQRELELRTRRQPASRPKAWAN